MRKQISCRVIASVPLIQNDDGLISVDESNTPISKTGGSKHPEYPAMMRIYLDTGPATGTLNILA